MTEELPVLNPETQLAFAVRLGEIERERLGLALATAVSAVPISILDSELAAYVPEERLGFVAALGLRGEVIFPCPVLLRLKPTLLTYYRLFFGLSQKEFYKGAFGKFRAMEDAGLISSRSEVALPALCRSLCQTAWLLVENLSDISLTRVRDLQLLTLGAQLRGSRLNEIGRAATLMVLARIRAAVSDDAVVSQSNDELLVRNASARLVRVSFSSDPDIAVSEQLATSALNRLAIEIKGGTDVSNVHNRLGEAGKSHQKAKGKGFTEFWTIVNAPLDPHVASRESPTTNLFFQLSEIIDPDHPAWAQFREQFTARLGVPAATS